MTAKVWLIDDSDESDESNGPPVHEIYLDGGIWTCGELWSFPPFAKTALTVDDLEPVEPKP